MIRPFASDDLDALVAIERASYPSSWPRAAFMRFILRPDADCRVLEQEGRVVGFFLLIAEPKGLHLANLAVHPDFRRRGLALSALECIDEMAKERASEKIVLEVLESNLAAQLLYRRAGYRAIEIVPNYYRNENAYRMVKSLVGWT